MELILFQWYGIKYYRCKYIVISIFLIIDLRDEVKIDLLVGIPIRIAKVGECRSIEVIRIEVSAPVIG